MAFYWIVPADPGAEHDSLEEFQTTAGVEVEGDEAQTELETKMHRLGESD